MPPRSSVPSQEVRIAEANRGILAAPPPAAQILGPGRASIPAMVYRDAGSAPGRTAGVAAKVATQIYDPWPRGPGDEPLF